MPHLQEAKLLKLRDFLSGLTGPPAKPLRGENNVWLTWDDSEKTFFFFFSNEEMKSKNLQC